jgi:hypothetical protein
MLSKRTINAIREIARDEGTSVDWSGADWFTNDVSKEKIVGNFVEMKNKGKLNGAGDKTLQEILEFHRLLNEIWG